MFINYMFVTRKWHQCFATLPFWCSVHYVLFLAMLCKHVVPIVYIPFYPYLLTDLHLADLRNMKWPYCYSCFLYRYLVHVILSFQLMDLRNGFIRLCYNPDFVSIID